MIKSLFFITALIVCSNLAFGLDRKTIEDSLFVSASNIKKSGKTLEDRKKEIDQFIREIDQELENTPDDTELLYFKGFLIRGYIKTLPPATTKEAIDKRKSISEESIKWLKESVKNNQDNLTLKQLNMLKTSGDELKVYAIGEILKFSNNEISQIRHADHEFIDKSRVEFRREKITSLIRLNRFDEVLSEIQLINEEFPAFASEEWDSAFLEQIEQAKLKLAAKKEKPKEVELTEGQTPQNTTAQAEENPQQVDMKEVPALTEQVKPVVRQEYIYFIIGILILLVFGFSLRSRFKKDS